ncbi:MAG: helix-turn-helix domain-containing protein [Gemmatimonadaceae bacterium]
MRHEAGQKHAAEVAVAAGFADQSHLTRWFRRGVGTTPHRWRVSSPA